MKRISLSLISLFISVATLFAGCSTVNPPAAVSAPSVGFAKGADVSWLTQLESEGVKFYDSAGAERELMSMLRDDVGVDAIRLRVWVDPADGWNNVDDVMVKARRAAALGLRLMIDFHFSDTWADPGHQSTPAAWANLDVDGLRGAVSAHVDDVLSRLKAEGIAPEWVQVGNETTQGMLWPLGRDDRPADLASLVNAGYDAVKRVFPEAKVIIHLDRGDDLWRYDHIFGLLDEHGARYDMIGMSLYPDPAEWQKATDMMIDNIKTLHSRYGKPVMICEIGMRYDLGSAADAMITRLRSLTEPLGYVGGIFYWEPEAPAGYNGGYDKGCFVDGRHNGAMNSFRK